jgi:RNA-directed DNA polymerase
MNEEIKRFSDFSDERGPLEGSKVKIDDILNIEIKITAFEVRQSKFKRENQDRVMTLQFKQENILHIIFTGSEVLIKQMEKYKDHLPFIAKIKHIDKYYTLS